ncbi:HAD family hydrolase [Sporosarcina highlanderae]|uniref:HAD-IB family hydrolase n=1 Tax=Sporosarcina highlanderae TaxID=3035916 RepID=A0ABT8JP46_9BACL|nr:HAD-IB family hydrolase [Sporosarcina highlanderae]MDN4606911.1 HAD-IB family hydrolase [Sporosarcina highlanderae]
MRVAIFDFDGTLYSKETFQLLMRHMKHHPTHRSKYKTFFRKILPLYIGYKIKIVPEHTMKERSMQIYVDALHTLPKNELDDYFQEMRESMREGFNKDVISRLKQHKKDGVHVMLVSGAYTSLLNAVTEDLGFDVIIGTEIPFTDEGALNRDVSIHHIQGKRKNEKILESLAGYEIDWTNSFAYGDSFSDLPVLELVGKPVAVKPEQRLKQVAIERDWAIL